MIEVLELSSDFNPEVEINVEESEASEVESSGFILLDSPGYNPITPEAITKSPLYSPISLDYFPFDSLYLPTIGSIFVDCDPLETETIIEVVEVVAPEPAVGNVKPATSASKSRRCPKKRRICYPQKLPTKFLFCRRRPKAPQYPIDL